MAGAAASVPGVGPDFLTGQGRCSIHATAPFGCAFFDAYMSEGEADERSATGLRAVLGRLANVMVSTVDAEPWTFGAAALMRNLAKRGLL